MTSLPDDHPNLLLISKEPVNIEYHLPLSGLGKYENNIMDYVHAAIKVIRDLGVEIPPIKIEINSKLPVSAGLASSAAISVVTIAALNKFFDLKLSILEICNLAYNIEQVELKTGAGQMDFYSCGLGGIIYINSLFVPPNPILKYKIPENFQFIIVDTQTKHFTSKVIRWKRERLASKEPLIMQYIEQSELTIQKMHSLLQQENFEISEFGNYISECHYLLKDFMCVSTDLLNTCVEAALKKGALGAKLTGTGLGGCMFALIERSKIDSIVKSISNLPVKHYITGVSELGLQIH